MHIIKIIFLCISITFNIAQSYAGEVLSGGTLQAYWQPYWDEDNSYVPDLHLRYITHRDDDKPRRVIDIVATWSESQIAEFVRQHFDHVPETFFTYKEGYANQPGTARVPYVRKYVECDAIYYEAKLAAFVADHHSKLSSQDILNDERFAGCSEIFPYIANYYPKESISTGLKNSPDDHASTLYTLKEYELITKIKTINNEWIYASLYNKEQPALYTETKGYIRLKDLTPLN